MKLKVNHFFDIPLNEILYIKNKNGNHNYSPVIFGKEYSYIVMYNINENNSCGEIRRTIFSTDCVDFDIYRLTSKHKIILNRLQLYRVLLSLQTIKGINTLILDRLLDYIRKDKDTTFISIMNNKCITLANHKKNKYNESKRVNTSLGRFIRRNLKTSEKEISIPTLSEFCHTLEAHLGMESHKIKIYSANDITKIYNDNTDIYTCMTGHHSIYTELYALNPDKVQLVVHSDSARALLWTCDDGTKVLDRIYPNSSPYVKKLLLWANSQGYLVRGHNGIPSSHYVELSDNSIRHVTLRYKSYFPYLDTFRFSKLINLNTIILSNKKQNLSNTLGSTHGTLCFLRKCSICGNHYTNYLIVKNKVVCPYCFKTFIKQCTICGKYFPPNSNFLPTCNKCTYRYVRTCIICSKSFIRTKHGQKKCEVCLNDYNKS